MLRKIWLVVVLFGFLIFNCYAQYPETSKEYILENDTPEVVLTAVSTSTIVPNRTLIHGFTVSSTRAGESSYASLYDEASGDAHLTSNVKGEAEADADEIGYRDFSRPKTVANGLTVVLGPYSAIIMDYSK